MSKKERVNRCGEVLREEREARRWERKPAEKGEKDSPALAQAGKENMKGIC